VSIAHWDEVEKHHRAKGPMDATWSRLGDAAGAKGVGVNRIEIAPGKLATPPHSHGASEEIYYVLGGSGLVWQDEEVCEVGPGDCIVQLANNFEHTLRGGPDGLDLVRRLPELASPSARRARSILVARAIAYATWAAVSGGRSAAALGEEAVAVARETGDPAAIADALMSLSMAKVYTGGGREPLRRGARALPRRRLRRTRPMSACQRCEAARRSSQHRLCASPPRCRTLPP